MTKRPWVLAGSMMLLATPVLANHGHGGGPGFAADLPALFAQADADGDGRLTPDEYQAFKKLVAQRRAEARFKRLDTDGDGTVSLAELQAAAAAHHECTGHKGQANATDR
jgi:Ca2+-binding EF-hand superfamily protein